jgi:glycosyltransferase involved in cell wall biosynthesis
VKAAIVVLTDFDIASAPVRRVQLIGKGLAMLGHEVHIVVPQRFRPGPASQEVDGLSVHWATLTTVETWSTISARLKARWATTRLVSHLAADGLDWLILYNLGLEGIPLLLAARRHGARVAAEYCDVRVRARRADLEDLARAAWQRTADILVPRFTQLNVTISQLLEHWLRSVAPNTPTLIVPPLVDADLFHTRRIEAQAFRDRWKLHDIPVISYLGSFWSVEGVSVLLNAASQLIASGERFKLVISGMSLEGRECDNVPQIVQDLNLESHVVLTGWLPTEEVVAAMSAADILVIPKIDHVINRAGVPTKLAEYLAMERAVVVSRVGDIPMYLSDNRDALLCEPTDPHALAEALRRLLRDPALRRYLGGNARHTALGCFDYRAASRRIEAALFSQYQPRCSWVDC